MFFDLLLWQENHNAITIFFISTSIFASEPMTLPETDHVSFLVEHTQTFFAGELADKRGSRRHFFPTFRENIAVAKTSYKVLEIFHFITECNQHKFLLLLCLPLLLFFI